MKLILRLKEAFLFIDSQPISCLDQQRSSVPVNFAEVPAQFYTDEKRGLYGRWLWELSVASHTD
jgi:hypothetical protein